MSKRQPPSPAISSAAASSSGRKKPKQQVSAATTVSSAAAKEPDVVLRCIRQLRSEKSAAEARAVATASGLSTGVLAAQGIVEVVERDSHDVSGRIEELVVSIVHQILSGGSFEFTVPNRGTANQIYVEELDRNVLGDKVIKYI